MNKLFDFSVKRPKFLIWIMVFTTVAFLLTAALPSIWPNTFTILNPLVVDTDPENMLPEDEAVRVFHHLKKKEFSLHDILVLGIVNVNHPEGVFNPDSLNKIFELAEFSKTLHWPNKDNPEEQEGVIEVDIIAPSTVDTIVQGGAGTVKFEWLMPFPPTTAKEALSIRHKAERIPFLNGTLLSENGKAIAIYLPLTSKDISHKVSNQLKEKIATFTGEENYYITGLPVAEDTFGLEMFKQMAISAPLAMLFIFLLMLFFFKKIIFIISPLIVAIVSVILTMGLLIATGNTVHIMSSMIPIFIMPIAVLDAIHILSEFFDRYPEIKDRKKTILKVMETLSAPMLYTTLTTTVGFASLALTPIPPVQIFGLFVAFGVLVAWFWTVTFIPAFIMLIPQKSLENFGSVESEEDKTTKTLLSSLLAFTGRSTFNHAKGLMFVTAIITLIAAYGISQININDNPIKWFKPSHPIRVADRVLNEHFGGTYMAYLSLEGNESKIGPDQYAKTISNQLASRAKELKDTVPAIKEVIKELQAEILKVAKNAASKQDLLDKLTKFAYSQADIAPDDQFDAWDEVLTMLDREQQEDQIFKQPEVLTFISTLQESLLATGIVGKSNSLADIVKTVHRELLLGEEKQFRIPDSANAVAQTLMTYQNSHRPQDLWHFVTPDYRKASIWVQLKSGDNMDMAKVVNEIDNYIKYNPPPKALKLQWFGLTYINLIWQEKMVHGMLQAFIGSFLVVLLMMIFLFRSALWGILSMVPLTVTIAFIYGAIGLIGKDYDMSVAVLSSLSLGLAVDYAIHFLARSRMLQKEYGSWSQTISPVFGEPARAISRNVIVVGAGFLPLLAASLVPYQTVGVLIAAILIVAGAASLLILPSLITLLEPWFFPETKISHFVDNCATWVVSAITIFTLIAINVHQHFGLSWSGLIWLSVIMAVVLIGVYLLILRRNKC